MNGPQQTACFAKGIHTQNTRLSTSCQKVVIIDHFWVVRVVTVTAPFLTTLRSNQMVPKLGYLGNNFWVVNADNFDNYCGDNHKAVLVTTVLTTR